MLRGQTLRSAAILAIVVSGTLMAALVSIGPWPRQPETRASEVGESSLAVAFASQLESIESRVSDLARRVEQLETDRLAVREPLIPEPAAAVAKSDDSLVALAERVFHLEQRAQEREQQLARLEDDWSLSPTQVEAIQDRIAAAHETIRDQYLSDSDKADAWLDLAQQEVYPWTDDIITEMTSIGLSSTDDRAREVVWIGAETGFRNDLLVQPLISALSDPEANVREEAADALSQYLNVSGVQNALTWTSIHDENETVRNEALRVLREQE